MKPGLVQPVISFRQRHFFAFVLAVAAIFQGHTFAQPQTGKPDLARLELNRLVKRELTGGDLHDYRVNLEAGTFVMFESVSSRQPTKLALYDAKGNLVYQQWRDAKAIPAGLRQSLKRVIETSGAYRLEVRANGDQKAPIPYELRIAELRPATETDRVLQTAEANQRNATHLSEQERKFDEAIALGEPTLATYLKLMPPDASDIGNLAIVLQNAYESRGYHRDLERREQLLEIAARNREAMFGPNNLHVAVLYNWLAELADPVRAGKWFQKTMEIVVKNVGPEHSYVASVIGGWAISIEALGDKARAAEMYERAVRLMEKAEGPEHPMLSPLLINHGQMLMDKKDWAAADEAAALDLWGTKLVVLSACETGVGAVKNGEGVFGLRRALTLAGAETQVASLWRADDLVTRKLMGNFYGKLNASLGRAEGLRQAQLEMLRGRTVNQAPYYWANFICIGEWKPLDK